MLAILALLIFFFFFFNDTATTEIYTLSLHDALPIYPVRQSEGSARGPGPHGGDLRRRGAALARRGERSEEHTSELQSQSNLVCRLLLEKKKNKDTHGCIYQTNSTITSPYLCSNLRQY